MHQTRAAAPADPPTGRPLDRPVRRFGAFELDSRAGELRKHGLRIRLQQQPLRLLEILLWDPGAPVTREELRRELWRADVHVDFDHSLNSAVNKLRDALGDTPGKPRFIETVARGYRFIAPVSDAALVPSVLPDATPTLEPASVDVTCTPSDAAVRRPRRRGALLAGALLASALLVWQSVGVPTGAPSPHIALAVMPFQNLSADPDQEFVSDGFTEEMIAQLGQLDPQRLEVIARTSAMHYKHTTKRVDQIGAELGVGYILEGSIRRSENRLRITVQLIRVRDQVQLWARSYERDFKDVLALQAEVTAAVADQIGGTLDARPPLKAAAARTTDPTVYEAYLKGRYLLDKAPRGLESAIEQFQRAIALDPTYAPAYAGLSDAFGQLGWGLASQMPPWEAYPQARAAALRALELDARLAEAHVALARILWKYEWNWADARAAFERALALNPNLATAYESYFDYLSAAGELDAAGAALTRAATLDPVSLTINYDFGLHLARTGNPPAAIDRLRKALELDPTSGFVRHVIGELYEEQGDWRASLDELEAAVALAPDTPHFIAALGHARARSGDRTGAADALAALQRLAATSYVSPHEFALVHVGMGHPDAAIDALESAFANRDPWISMLGLQTRFDPLAAEPRFRTLKRRLGLQAGATSLFQPTIHALESPRRPMGTAADRPAGQMPGARRPFDSARLRR
jgi:TolB-like protein/DNA-binding winged helix-turn-helix (wHTH) protein/Tfp pilus assembly protein PilF